jgi:hypothetical protein
MKISFKNIIWLLLPVIISGCSKKNENYKALIKDGEIHYPGVIANTNYRAGNLRTMLLWNPSPDPKIAKYVVYWNNKQDSLTVSATSHDPLDTVKTLVSNLKEGTYNFNVYSIDSEGHVSISTSINGVRVYGPIYLSGIFNRGYNADTPFLVNPLAGSVKLKFNAPDSINLKTVIKYISNAGKTNTVILKPDSNTITLNDFKFGTDITYQSSYFPLKGAIDTFTVANAGTYPFVRLYGDVSSAYIKNPGYPFIRGDNGRNKWGTPKDWQWTPNVVNQTNNGNGGGWSTDYGGVVHIEAKDYSGDPVINGKVYQSFTILPGSYELDFSTAGYGGTIDANEMVALGSTLPDIDKLKGNANVLAIFNGNQNNLGGKHTLSFTITQKTTICIGWVITTGSYTYMQFTGVALRIL